MDFNNKRKLQKDVAKALKNEQFHKTTRNLLVTTIAAGSVLSGLTLVSKVNPNLTSSVVEARAVNKKIVKVHAESARVKKNAAVYNKNGKKIGSSLKKGKAIKVYGTKIIKGKKYYNLSRGRYVLVANITVAKIITLTNKSYIYNSKCELVSKKPLNKGEKIKVYGIKTIKGKKYYNLGNGKYVPVLKTKAPESTTPSKPSNSNSGSANNSGAATPSKPSNSNSGSANNSGGATAPSAPSTGNSGSTGNGGAAAPSKPSTGNSDNTNNSGATPSKPNNGNSDSSTTPSEPGKVSRDIASVLKAVYPGIKKVNDGLNSLGGKITDPKYVQLQADIEQTLKDIKVLASYTDVIDFQKKLVPVHNDMARINQELAGIDIDPDLVTVWDGIRSIGDSLNDEQVANLKEIYNTFSNYSGDDVTLNEIKDLITCVQPGMQKICLALTSLSADLKTGEYDAIENDINTFLNNQDINKLPAIYENFYKDIQDLANTENGKHVSADISDLLAGIALTGQSFGTNGSTQISELQDIYGKLAGLKGNSDPNLAAIGDLIQLLQPDFLAINHSIETIKADAGKLQIPEETIQAKIDDILQKIRNLPIDDPQNIISHKGDLEAIYQDLVGIVAPFEDSDIKNQLASILGSIQSINNKLTPDEIAKFKTIYLALENNQYTWLNNIK
ncbi:SLAP domain-containing protein [Lactobacillus sp. ESL0785]|uniref:SLAP domain-containing protein n=1 Tax=Lactobacillus sp. ESL0785 TaxID=2983232 RepID=UPI0023F671B8|nr:SLAP domain-containing protein [Lactobacillus sp. ESL0785]WEV70700.1 SLAP domain-containing protein [Lactobacillus sp. ESL0785]